MLLLQFSENHPDYTPVSNTAIHVTGNF